jgi:hypothetical protein
VACAVIENAFAEGVGTHLKQEEVPTRQALEDFVRKKMCAGAIPIPPPPPRAHVCSSYPAYGHPPFFSRPGCRTLHPLAFVTSAPPSKHHHVLLAFPHATQVLPRLRPAGRVVPGLRHAPPLRLPSPTPTIDTVVDALFQEILRTRPRSLLDCPVHFLPAYLAALPAGPHGAACAPGRPRC